MGQHAHKLRRSDPYQWRQQNKAPLQCTDTYEGKIKAVQPHERPRMHSPSYAHGTQPAPPHFIIQPCRGLFAPGSMNPLPPNNDDSIE